MNRIKQLRQQKNLSIDELSKQLKEQGVSISPASISKYERGARNPKIENWIKLAFYFDVPVAYLQGVSDDNNTHGHHMGLYDTNVSDLIRFDKVFQNGKYEVSDGAKIDLVGTVDQFRDLLERNIPKKDDSSKVIKEKKELITIVQSVVNSLYAMLIVLDKDDRTKNVAINETKELAKSLIKLWHGPNPFEKE